MSTAPAEDENLFRYLRGEISFEEWARARRPSDDYDSGAETADTHTEQEDIESDDGTSFVGKSGKPQAELDQEVRNAEDDDVVVIEQESTMKYLLGEIPFEKYQNILENIKEENVEIGEAGVEVLTTFQPVQSKPPPPPERKNHKNRKSKLPRHLQGLMGEANMKFARGETDETIKMCMEIIRLAPTAPEPFQTLGLLYEDKGDNEKALQFLLIAAHLNPSDPEEWIKLAEMSLEVDNTKQAIMCYDKAIKYDSKNVSLWWARCDLYERSGDRRHALDGYQNILPLLPDNEGNKYLELARDITKNLHELGEVERALLIMETALVKHPESVAAEDVNLLIELYMTQQTYIQPLMVLSNHCGVNLTPAALPDSSDEVCTVLTEVQVPSELLIDLRIKLVVCLVHLSCYEHAGRLLGALYDENVDDFGDLYLDVAEAYMDTGRYVEAEPLLDLLVKSNSYNSAAVWLRYAECLNSLCRIQQAAAAYERVVDMAPEHMSARVSLSSLQQQLGRYDEALSTLDRQEPANHHPSSSSTTVAPVQLRLELPRCLLLLSQDKRDEFITCSRRALFLPFINLFSPHHQAIILSNKSQKHRVAALRQLMGSKIETSIKEAAGIITDSAYSVDDLWDLYLKLCDVLVESKRIEEFLETSIMALISPIFQSDADKTQEVEFICLIACLLNKNGHYAYNFIREICVKQLHNNRAWNLFSQIVTLSQDFRHNRFCLRLMLKHPTHLPLGLLNGHNALVSGTYKHALGEYVAAFRQEPHNPLISLCIGLTFMHMASQKFAGKRHCLIVQASAFLNQYLELRGECQESYYNLGRAMHQIGLGHAAVYYYQKALSLPPAIPDQPHIFDLSHEIAFNLCLIYKNSGSNDLAAHIMNQYIII